VILMVKKSLQVNVSSTTPPGVCRYGWSGTWTGLNHVGLGGVVARIAVRCLQALLHL
jgi:hypothetical protein